MWGPGVDRPEGSVDSVGDSWRPGDLALPSVDDLGRGFTFLGHCAMALRPSSLPTGKGLAKFRVGQSAGLAVVRTLLPMGQGGATVGPLMDNI